jgi:hypothetical protein
MAEIEVASAAVGVSGQVQIYDVMIDGQSRGRVQSGERITFPVTPGVHTVRLATARNSPPPVKVVVFGTTSLLCQTKTKMLFGIVPTGEPHTHIVVREHAEVPQGEVPQGITWKGETTRHEAGRDAPAPRYDLLAAD